MYISVSESACSYRTDILNLEDPDSYPISARVMFDVYLKKPVDMSLARSNHRGTDLGISRFSSAVQHTNCDVGSSIITSLQHVQLSKKSPVSHANSGGSFALGEDVKQ